MARRISAPLVKGGIGPLGSAASASFSLAGMSFTRGSEGFYHTSATSGAWASSNALRLENRGDGAGDLILLEGSSTTVVGASPRDVTGAGWSDGSAGYTRTADQAVGIDGATAADLITSVSGGYGTYQGAYTPTAARWSFSFWARRATGAGTDEAHYAVQNGGSLGTGVYKNTAITETWSRFDATGMMTAAGSYIVPQESRTTAGLTARDLAYLIDLVQWEAGAFPSSPIRTAGGTRAADTLTCTPAQLPAWLLLSGRIPYVSPHFASADLASGDIFWLLSLDDENNGIRFNRDGTDLRLEVLAGGVVKARSAALSFSRHALLGPVAWNAAAGTLTVAGSAGTTSAWSWSAPSTGFRIGGVYGASTELFGRVSRVWTP